MCLDGSAGGYWTNTDTDRDPTLWMIVFLGGGWCYDVPTCTTGRVDTLKSSNSWSDINTRDVGMVGVLNDYHNKRFANYIVIGYCDGSIYSSPRAIQGVQAILDHVFATTTIKDAIKELIVGGSSAGGIATMLYMNWIQRYIQQTHGLVDVSLSGLVDGSLFLQTNHTLIPTQYQQMVAYHHINITESLLPTCLELEHPHLCLFTPYLYPLVDSRLFFVMSAYDKIQMQLSLNITYCVDAMELCTSNDIQTIQQYHQTLIQFATQTLKYNDSIFLDACQEHIQTYSQDWGYIYINSVSMRDAFWNWYTLGDRTRYIDIVLGQFNHTCPMPLSVWYLYLIAISLSSIVVVFILFCIQIRCYSRKQINVYTSL